MCSLYVVRAEQTKESEAEKYIKLSESQWAEADVTRDTTIAERLLAEEFLGVGPDGSFYEKANDIADHEEGRGQLELLGA